MENKKDLMTQLALERTNMANERTMLAYIRTAITSFLFGTALIKFFEDLRIATYFGIIAIIAGILFLIAGLVYYPIKRKRSRKY